jgi:hypothetical protein
MMQFRGRLVLNKLLTSQYYGEYSIVYVAIEIGYGLEHIKMIAKDEFVLNQLNALRIHDTVQAEANKDDGKLFLKNITKSTFQDCEKCQSIKDVNGCFACEKGRNVMQERIDGVWKLFAIKNLNLNSGPAIKLIFKQAEPHERILGIVAFPNKPFYEVFSTITVQSNVQLSGWRNDKRHTLLSQVHPMETSNVKHEKVNNHAFCEICQKSFKTKLSFKQHERIFHRQPVDILNEPKQ